MDGNHFHSKFYAIIHTQFSPDYYNEQLKLKTLLPSTREAIFGLKIHALNHYVTFGPNNDEVMNFNLSVALNRFLL